ncbi:MAG: hypothetical protein LBU76_03995 [Azoarcus sp.]|jgi:hypothetical protein|nr:hypothetical protein [Azoarcus sp.]
MPWKSVDDWFKSILFMPVLMVIGVGLIEWRAGLAIAVLFAGVFLWVMIFGHRIFVNEERYTRDFPVLKNPPIETVSSGDGLRFDLHIAEVNANFIIGISCETEMDGTQ